MRTGTLLSLVPIVVLCTLLTACDELPMRLRQDPVGTAQNARTSRWRGRSSDGTTSRLWQVATGRYTFSFTENWTEGSKVLTSIHTVGTGRYEPSTRTNIYTYTRPVAGVVVVRTEESEDGLSSTDTVINSTFPLLKVGDKITYTHDD